MYCPQCGAEYREGFTECADCSAPLLAGNAPAEPRSSDPNLDLVVILETNNQMQFALAKGSLEDAGIPFVVLGQIKTLVNDVDPFLHKDVIIQVPRDREAEARELMDPLLNPEPVPPDELAEPWKSSS